MKCHLLWYNLLTGGVIILRYREVVLFMPKMDGLYEVFHNCFSGGRRWFCRNIEENVGQVRVCGGVLRYGRGAYEGCCCLRCWQVHGGEWFGCHVRCAFRQLCNWSWILGCLANSTVVVGGCNGNVESRWAVFRLRKNSLISDSCVGWDRSGSEMGNRYLGLGSLRFRMAVVILVSW